MAYKIDATKCENCGSCEDACPNEAISEKDEKRVIDPEKCVDCGTCIDECGFDAISEE